MLSRGESIQGVRHVQSTGVQLLNGVAEVQANCRQHLIVTRATEVDASARRADPLRKALLESRLTVLVHQLDAPLAALVLLADRREPIADRGQVRIRQKFLGIEHLGVRDRRSHVIADQSLVERVVFASRVLKYAVIEGRTLVPQASHISWWTPRSAARRE